VSDESGTPIPSKEPPAEAPPADEVNTKGMSSAEAIAAVAKDEGVEDVDGVALPEPSPEEAESGEPASVPEAIEAASTAEAAEEDAAVAEKLREKGIDAPAPVVPSKIGKAADLPIPAEGEEPPKSASELREETMQLESAVEEAEAEVVQEKE